MKPSFAFVFALMLLAPLFSQAALIPGVFISDAETITTAPSNYYALRQKLLDQLQAALITFKDLQAAAQAAANNPAPVISNIKVATTTSGTAWVEWVTNEPATSKIYYGQNTTNPSDGGRVVSSKTLTTKHAYEIFHLVPNTRYYFSLQVQDQGGAIAISIPQLLK